MEINDLNFQPNDAGLRTRLTEKCPRCNSMDTKFCYYNNYSLNQPRHYCKTCRRYWTRGGICRNIPIGGSSYRRNRRNRAAYPRAPLDPCVPTFARRRRRATNAGSMTVSGGKDHGRIISSMGVNFPNEFESRVSEFGHTIPSFGHMPLLSFNNNVVNVNNNLAPGFGTFLHPPPPPLVDGSAWPYKSLLMGVDPNENMFLWGYDGASGSGSSGGSGSGGQLPPLLPFDIDIINNDQWLEDIPEYTRSPPPLPPSA